MSYHREDLPGAGALTVASIFPAAVIAIELTTGLCAGVFFDPMPTVWHLLLVAFVPVCNVLLWRAVRGASDGTAGPPIWLVVAAGAAVCVAASYTLLFLPMLPMALIAVPFGIGLLPFAPMAGLVFALRWSFAMAAIRHGGGRLLFAGLALGAAALVLVDLRVTMTQVALDRYGGDADARASAVGLMRSWGDPALLLRQSYGDSGRAGGIGSFLASAWTNGTLFGERPRTADGRVFAVTDLADYAVAIVIASQLDNHLRPTQRTGWVSDYAGQQQYATICGKRAGCSATAAMVPAGSMAPSTPRASSLACQDERNPQDAARSVRSARSR